ncbi:hypothetical protein KIN20_031906, partial [Parelaphostrongylus tenuis]
GASRRKKLGKRKIVPSQHAEEMLGFVLFFVIREDEPPNHQLNIAWSFTRGTRGSCKTNAELLQ